MSDQALNVEKYIELALLGESQKLNFEQKMLIKKIDKMDNLPIPNAHAMKVMLLLRNENVKMNELITSIEKDQSLVAKIIKLVNSGFYGLRNTVDSVNRAISLLGIMNIKHVVYSATIMEMFSEDEQVEWNHSYSSSVLMQKLMKIHKIPAASNLPLTTLMHDIGKVVLRRFNPKKFQMVVMLAKQEKRFLHELEQEMLTLNHALLGGILLKKWKMTNDILVPIIFHHSETIPDDYVLETAMIQFVNWVDCMARSLSCPSPSPQLMDAAGIEEVDDQYWINYQEALIRDLEGGDEDEHPEEKRKKISQDKKFYNCAEIPQEEQEKAEHTQAQVERRLSDREIEVLDSHAVKTPEPEQMEPGLAEGTDSHELGEVSDNVIDTQVIKVNELREEIEEEQKQQEATSALAQEGERDEQEVSDEENQVKTTTDRIKKEKPNQAKPAEENRKVDKEGTAEAENPDKPKKKLMSKFIDFLKS